MTIDTLIFDLGGVLIDWDPRYLYCKLFATEAEIDYFLTHITDSDWNEQQDAGRPLAEATEELVARHPEWEAQIRAFYGRWTEMLKGPIEPTLALLKELKAQQRYGLFALTNWSAETWPIAWERYEFLHWFEGILVSGQEKIRKPHPRIYQLMEERFPLQLSTSLFIDDNLRNVKAARREGLSSIHFTGAASLRQELERMKIL